MTPVPPRALNRLSPTTHGRCQANDVVECWWSISGAVTVPTSPPASVIAQMNSRIDQLRARNDAMSGGKRE
jgi:hypothetical protein